MGKLTSKTKKMIAATTAFAMLAGVFSFGLTYNWFIEDNRTEVDMNGVVHGSYFESGSGTYEDPFEIARPVQLYYLSWLQEMGYFNQPEMDADGHEIVNADGTVSIRQFSFYLSEDLDMSEYTLPPIGTQTFPFVGEFNGRNHKIYNLTVDNDKSALTDDPSSEAYNFQIIGLFGVIGSLDGQDANTVNGLPPEGDNAGLPTPGYTYDTSALSVKNFQIEDTFVKTSTSNSLIGIAAGYVNGPLSNIAVNTSTITVASGVSALTGGYTDKISDYSIVGYCTDKYKETLHIVDTTICGASGKSSTFVTTSQGNTWGGSIDMKTTLSRITKSKNLSGALTGQIPAYPKTETAIKYADGTVSDRVVTSTSTTPGNYRDGAESGSSGTYYYHDDDVGSYYWSNMGSTNTPKAYVQGYTDIEDAGSKTVHYFSYSNQTETAYYFNTENGYLTVGSNGGISYSTSTADSVKWHFDTSNRYLYCVTVVDNLPVIRYLNCDINGEFFVSSEGSTAWTNNSGSFSYIYAYEGGYEFHIKASGSEHYFTNANNLNNGFEDRTTTSEAGVFTFENFGNSYEGRISVVHDGITYYLTWTDAGDYKTDLQFRDDPSGYNSTFYRTTGTNRTNGSVSDTHVYLACQLDNNTFRRFIYWNDSTWRVGYSSKEYVDLVATGSGSGSDALSVSLNKTNVTDNKITQTDEVERSGQAGYIPLAVNGSTTTFRSGNPTKNDYLTSDKNTGYIVGGFYDKTNGGDGQINNYRGDVRVADYAINNIESCYSNNAFKDLYTVKNGTRTKIDVNTYKNATNSSNLEYKKLHDSIIELERNLQGQSNVSGIHFMDSTISMDHLITAPKVLLNKQTYTNYEMPEDSIDFTLKDKGFINFFAGNYQNDNNSFFTLNKIERDPNNSSKILDIKCISLVFSTDDPSKPYIYKYTDGTYSDGLSHGSNTSFTTTVTGDLCTYNVCFNTSDIGKNTDAIPKGKTGNKYVYYFEIPVNNGEYALGSVPNACGGYLIYLDISAASQTIHRQTLSETFITTEEVYEHPLGVGYYDGDLDGTDSNPVNDRDSVAISLDEGAQGDYSVTRDGNDVDTGTNSTGATLTYPGDGLNVGPLTPSGKRTTTKRRMTDYDFNDITGIYVKQVTEVEIVNNHSKVSVSFSYNDSAPSGTDDYTHVLSFSFEFDGTQPFYAYKYYYHESDQIVELMFMTNTEFSVSIDELTSGYGVTADGGKTRVTELTDGEATELTIAVTDAYTADVWEAAGAGSFSIHYQYSDKDTVEETYDFTYDSITEPAGDGTGPNKEKTLTINNGIYTITVTVTSGTEDIDVYYYNLGNNIVVGGTGTATVNVVSGTASLTNKNVLAPTVNTVYSISTLSVGENKNKKTID